MNQTFLREDFAILRLFIQATDFARVLRWRRDEQQPFASAEKTSQMDEGNMQHCAGMSMMAAVCVVKAELEGDNKTASLNMTTVTTQIFLHDADEYLAGDSRTKCEIYRAKEQRARSAIYDQLETFDVGKRLVIQAKEYHEKLTPEARFVKALDELQAWVYIIQTRGFTESSRDFENPEGILGYVLALDFPTLARLAKILLRIMQNPKFITTEVQELQVID
jgi:5'-deoxynucleotidase YfbR-like HD superfamily hydrolase